MARCVRDEAVERIKVQMLEDVQWRLDQSLKACNNAPPRSTHVPWARGHPQRVLELVPSTKALISRSDLFLNGTMVLTKSRPSLWSFSRPSGYCGITNSRILVFLFLVCLVFNNNNDHHANYNDHHDEMRKMATRCRRGWVSRVGERWAGRRAMAATHTHRESRDERHAQRREKPAWKRAGKYPSRTPFPSDNYTLNLRIGHSFSRSRVSMTSIPTATNLTPASIVFDRTKLVRSLLRAVHRGDVARVRELLHERGAPVDARDELNHNVTPLHVACRLGNADCVRLLVEYGAHVHAFDDRRYPPLYYAVQQLHREAAGVLVRECRADVDLRCGPDRRPLLHQVHGSVAQAEMLLRLGANVNALCDCGQTALFPAAFRGHEELVCLLIDHKADVSIAATMLDFPLSEEQRNERRVRVTRAPQPTGGSSRSRKLNSTTVFVCVCFGLQVYPLGTAADAALTPAIRNIIQTRGASRATTSQLNSVPTLNLTGEQSRHDTNGASPSTTELLASFGLSLGHWCRFTRSSAKTRFSERCQSSSCSRYLQHYARNE